MYSIRIEQIHYKICEYVNENRLVSYYKQIEEIISCGTKGIL